MNTAAEMHRPASTTHQAWLVLLVLVPAPSIGVLLAMPDGAGTIGKVIYAAMKAWILVLPILWVLSVNGRLAWPAWSWKGTGVGLLWGVGIAAAILAGFFAFGPQLVDVQQVRAKAMETGLADPRLFVPFFVYLCLVNSLLEEYVWRWFVYGRCRDIMPRAPGWAPVVLSAGLFTIHHAVALSMQMAWLPALLGSTGVMVGGIIWGGLYRRYGRIWPCWISHVIADVAVAVVAWRLIHGG